MGEVPKTKKVEGPPRVSIMAEATMANDDNKMKNFTRKKSRGGLKPLAPLNHRQGQEDDTVSLGKYFLRSRFDEGWESDDGGNYDEELTGNLSYIGKQETQLQNSGDYGNLFIWYSTSPKWRRFILQMLAFLCFILVIHIVALLYTIYLIIFPVKIPDPNICSTEDCVAISNWIQSAMNTNVNPCDDFYEYVCGNYDKNEAKEDIKDALIDPYSYRLLRTVLSDFNERNIYGKIFSNKDHDPIYEQIPTFFKSCLDRTTRNEVGEAPLIELLDQMGLNIDVSKDTVAGIMYNFWAYVGKNGFFDMNLLVNPYDAFRQVQAEDYTENRRIYEPYFIFTPPELESQWEHFSQQIKTLLKIDAYTAIEMREALRYFHKIFLPYLGDVWRNPGQYKNIHTTVPQEFRNKFNCDQLGLNLDREFNIFENQYLYTPHPSFRTDFVDAGNILTNFICSGVISWKLHTSATGPLGIWPKYESKLTPELLHRVFLLYYFFIQEIGDLSPKTAELFSKNSDTFSTAANLENGAECFRSLKRNIPHLIHTRLMQILEVSDEKIGEAEAKYKEMYQLLRNWLQDPKREKIFQHDTLSTYRQAINSYSPVLITPRFSVKQLENFGYKKTGELMTKHNYLKNVRTLRSNLAEGEIKRWRMEDGHYFPLSPFLFRRALREVVQTNDIHTTYNGHTFRMQLSIMPAMLYSDLYSNDDILALKYGGVWAYLTHMIVQRWRDECDILDDRSKDIDIDMLKTAPCTGIRKGETKNISFYDARIYDNKWLELTISLIFKSFRKEQKKRDQQHKLRNKALIGMDYTEEQLLFIKLTRHQCKSPSISKSPDPGSQISNEDQLRSGFSQSIEFRKAWNCPAGSKMHSRNSCFFRE